jgi:hypothetical protein
VELRRSAGINMPNFSYATTSNGMLSYAHWSGTAMAAMKANTNFSPALTLIVNMQAASDYEYTNSRRAQQSVPRCGIDRSLHRRPLFQCRRHSRSGVEPGHGLYLGRHERHRTLYSGNGWTLCLCKSSAPSRCTYTKTTKIRSPEAYPPATMQNHDSSFMAGTVVAQQMLEHLKILGPNAPQQIWSLAQDQFNYSAGYSCRSTAS